MSDNLKGSKTLKGTNVKLLNSGTRAATVGFEISEVTRIDYSNSEMDKY